MAIETHILGRWEGVRSELRPVLTCKRRRGALTRVRETESGDMLLRLALGDGACGMPLRQTSAWAPESAIARLSERALIERLEKAAPWLGDILGALLGKQATAPIGWWPGHRLRAIDGTTGCEPGATRALPFGGSISSAFTCTAICAALSSPWQAKAKARRPSGSVGSSAVASDMPDSTRTKCAEPESRRNRCVVRPALVGPAAAVRWCAASPLPRPAPRTAAA